MPPLSQQTSFAEDSLASSPAPPLEDETMPSTCGQSSGVVSATDIPRGVWLRTSLVLAMKDLSGSLPIWRLKAIRSGRSKSILRLPAAVGAAPVSSGWPTPTAKANHDSPSMAKWPAYALYHRTAGRTTPRLWEWMMGFPDGWTDCTSSGMPSLHTPRKSSGEPL